MAGSESLLSTTPPANENSDSALENSPLLGESRSREWTRRRSSIVSNAQHGYHTISADGVANANEPPQQSLLSILGILSVLLVGVFISQLDGTLLFATIGNISAEFNDLQNSSWLVSSYLLSMCVVQPLYGKLSDIFGRKTMLQLAYFLFALGNLICGLGRSMFQVIFGRVIQGLGGAGMVSLVSILITDLVPLREVASYRSYVNIVQTVGRSCGGPIGGILAQTVGWRWAFLVQAPLTAIAMVLVAWKLKVRPKDDKVNNTNGPQSIGTKLKRIDLPGALLMSMTILAAMLILDIGGEKISWTSPTIAILVGTTFLSGLFFYFAEKYWAKEPIFPLRLLTHWEVVLDYILSSVQVASQMALMFFIPIYFQVTKNSSPAEAGAYMIPSVMGNTFGGLLTGLYVKRTGRYKQPIILACLSSMLCFTLLLITWNGKTPVWQTLFVFLGGFGTGSMNSALFVDLAASVDESEIAIASSALYLSLNIGSVFGVTAASAVFGTSLKTKLAELLSSWPNGQEIAEKAALNIEYVQALNGRVHELVVSSYVFAFRHSFAFSLCCATLALFLGLLIKERRLHH